MSPIELLIEDNVNKNINTKESSTTASIQSSKFATSSSSSSSDIDNQSSGSHLFNHVQETTNFSLLKMSTTSESKPNNFHLVSNDTTDESKKNFTLVVNNNTIIDKKEVMQKEEEEEEEEEESNNFIQPISDENISSSSLSTTSSLSPMSDSVLSQSKNTNNNNNNSINLNENERDINLDKQEIQNVTQNDLVEKNETKTALNDKPLNCSTQPPPPNTLALHINLNEEISLKEYNDTEKNENSDKYYDEDVVISQEKNELNNSPSNSFPVMSVDLQSSINKTTSTTTTTTTNNNHHLHPLLPQPAHVAQQPYIYSTQQYSNQPVFINSNYNNYSSAGYNSNQQYLIQQVPVITQHVENLASSSSSASTPTLKQQKQQSSSSSSSSSTSSSSSSSSNVTSSNEPINNGNILPPLPPPLTPLSPPTNSSTIFVHIEAGHAFRVQLGDEIREIFGPATVKMVSNDGSQPVPIQLTTPSPGQLVQQIIDENGILTHLILSSQHHHHQTVPASSLNPNVTSVPLNNQVINKSATAVHTSSMLNINNNKKKQPNQNISNNINSPTNNLNPYFSIVQANPNLVSNYYPYNLAASQSSQTFQSIQTSHSGTATPVLNHLTVFPNYQQQQPTYYNNNNNSQYISSPNQHYTNNLISLIPSPSQSPQPIVLTKQQHQDTSPINFSTESDNQNNKTNNQLNINSNNNTNLTSVSPSSSSSASSCSSTSTKSSQSLSNNNNGNLIKNGKNKSNEFSNNRNTNKEQKSFRKYNSNSLVDNFFNNSANVISTSLISSKPYNTFFNTKSNKEKIYQQNLPKPNLNNKKQQFQNILAFNQNNHQLHNSFSLQSIQNYTAMTEHQQKQYNQQFNKSHFNYINNNNQVTGYRFTEHIKHMNDENSNNNNKNDSILKQQQQQQQQNKQILSDNCSDELKISTETSKMNPEMLKNLEFFKTILNRINKPIVCEIEAQSVLVRLSPIDLDDPENSITLNKISANNSNNDNNNNMDYVLECFETLNYTLELSGETTSNFNEVYTGDANEITLKDLRPNTKYLLRVYASIDRNCRGDYTNVVTFQTEPYQPDQPYPVKQTGLKKKNEISLKWNSVNDNGSKIFNYILEMQEHTEGNNFRLTDDEKMLNEEEKQQQSENDDDLDDSKQVDFVQIYKGPLKQFIVKKLKPSTCYMFRLAAENELGVSEFSNISLAYTSGCVPNSPEPPVLVDSSVSSLTLGWSSVSLTTKNLEDIDYELQMINTECAASIQHGFLPVFNGPLLSYTVNDLKLCCVYQFRLRAKNEEGYSAWSQTVKYSTKANVPKAPIKLRYKIQPSPVLVVKVTWDEPKENGGNKIQSYCLELAESIENNFIVIYDGDQLEYSLEQALKPGFNYKLRVSCSNSIGTSDYSEIVTFLTPASLPDKCLPPKLYGKPKANSVQLRWSYPENDGGSQILSYEIYLNQLCELDSNNDNENENIIWKGNDLNCALNSLLPGRNYRVKLRALNKIGSSDWSEFTEFTSGSGVPDSPALPIVIIKSSNCLIINWNEPLNNGASITDYQLEWSPKENTNFTQVYCGPLLKHELKGGFLPATKYFFRVKAINLNGSSNFSPQAECLTLASVPSIVNSIKIEEINSDSIRIFWKQPISNGSPILFYNIDLVENATNTSVYSAYIVVYNQEMNCEYKIESLQPDKIYKFRIQAANSIGVGHFSNMIKFKTKALPPLPPHIECVSTSYNNIKLKWNHLLNNNNNNNNNINTNTETNLISSVSLNTKQALNDYQIVYNLEMMNASNKVDDKQFKTVYSGPLNIFKVNKLQESTDYLFRINALNETGQGKFSDTYRFTTTKSPPLILKGPTISELSSYSCLVEWLPAKFPDQQQQQSTTNECLDSLEYCLQLQSVKKDADYKEIYKGESCSYRIKNLEPNMDYNVRICAIRVCHQDSNRICSPFSSHTNFTTIKINQNKINNPKKSQSDISLISSSDNKETSNLTKLSRFILPSFYLNLNTSKTSNVKTNQVAFTSQNSQKMQTNLNNNNNINNKKSNTTNAANTVSPSITTSNNTATNTTYRKMSDSNISNNSMSLHEKITNRQITDQQWAFLFIIILVIIAFLIAYVANSFFTSYYDLTSSEL